MSNSNEFAKKVVSEHNRARLKVLGVFCAVVAFVVTYCFFIWPAISMENSDNTVATGNEGIALLSVTDTSITKDGLTYTFSLNSNGLYTLMISGTSEGTVTIPENLMTGEEFSVYKDSMAEVVFNITADTMTIGTGAFEGCSALSTVDFTNYNCAKINISDNAFKDCSVLSEIAVPSGLSEIGSYAFSGCTELKSVTFGRTEYDENNLLVLSKYVFKDCVSLTEVDLTPLQNLDTIEGYVFYDCENIEIIKVPGNVSTLSGGSFGRDGSSTAVGLNSLTEIVFEENYKLTNWPVNVIRNSEGIKTLDLTPLKALTSIGGSFTFPNTGLKTVLFPSSLIELNGSVFRDISYIETVIFEEGSQLKIIAGNVFEGTTGLRNIDLSVCTNLQTISTRAFAGSGIEEIVLPVSLKTINSNAFGVNDDANKTGCVNLKNVYYNAAELTTCGAQAFSGVEGATLFIGDTVDVIPADLISAANTHFTKYVFKGENEFTVSGTGTATGLSAPLDTLGGDYYVSADGDLYKLDKTNNTATLVYKENTGVAEFVVPANVGLDGNYTVTEIGSYAFLDSGVTAVSFEALGNVTAVSETAFVDCITLAGIGGYSSVPEVIDYFTENGVTTTEDYYFNTALTGAPKTEGFPGTAIESGTISVSDKELTVSGSDGKYLTGESAEISVTVSNTGNNSIFRLYFECESGCEFIENISELAGCPVTYHSVEGTNIHYYEIGPWTDSGSTATLPFDFVYPNFSPDNSNLKIWVVKGDADTFAEIGETAILPVNSGSESEFAEQYPELEISTEYFDFTWNTKAYSHPVTKNLSSTPGLFVTDDKQAAVAGIAYSVSLQNSADGKEDVPEDDTNAGVLNTTNYYGSDFVTSVEFKDTVILPEGLVWREGLVEAVQNGNYRYDNSADEVYVTVDGVEYLLFSVTKTGASSLGYSVSDVRVCINENEEIVAEWSCINLKEQVEIPSCAADILFGSEVIILESAIPDGETITFNLENNISSTEYYTYAEPATTSYTSSDAVQFSGQGELTLTKITDNVEDKHGTGKNAYFRLGEDVVYKITASNNAPYDYSELDYIYDDLKSAYIKPEDIVKMFEEDAADDGYSLSLTISKAAFTKSTASINSMSGLGAGTIESVQSIDQDTVVNITSPQYIGTVPDYSIKYEVSATDETKGDADILFVGGILEFKLSGDNLLLTVKQSNNVVLNEFEIDCTAEAIQEAFDSLGFVIRSDTVYDVRFNVLNGLPAGSEKDFYIYATFKDTLMKTGKDVQSNYDYPKTVEANTTVSNTATAYNEAGEKLASGATSNNVRPDIMVGKLGVEEIEDETVVDYSVKVNHYGHGSYEVLPIVDFVSGVQLILAPVADNNDEEWTGKTDTYTENGVVYYVLGVPEGETEYTYKGVNFGGYYADSVTVSLLKDDNGAVLGVQSLIKWYIKDTAKQDFEIKISYKTLVDCGRIGYEKELFRIENTVYAGERAGHRVYADCAVQGSVINVDKVIVTAEAEDNPAFDTTETYTRIIQGDNVVTYRLELINTDDTTRTVSGISFYDELPEYTLEDEGYGFIWEKGTNVSLHYVETEGSFVTYNGGSIEESGGEEWNITDISPRTGNAESKRLYLEWSDDLKVTLEPQSSFYIYVTLTYPDEEVWDDYVTAQNGETLYNSFCCGPNIKTVSHDLTTSGEAFLQKGVYELGYYSTSGGSTNSFDSYYRAEDRYTYINTVANINPTNNQEMTTIGRGSVAYYVVLSNSGNTKLYLSTIYDQLPEGFEFYSLRNNTIISNGSDTYGMTGTGVGTWAYTRKDTIKEGSKNCAHPLAAVGKDLNWSGTNLNGYRDGQSITITLTSSEVVDGHQVLAFDLSGGILDEQTDDYGTYLLPGQWITFGYECLIGYDSETEDMAENTIAMKYLDPLDAGTTVDSTTPVEVSQRYNTAESNDGTRELWNNSEVQSYGFGTAEDEGTNWLVSQVTVYRGTEVVPGITKTVYDSDIQAEVGNINLEKEEIAQWTVTAYNDGTAPLANYTIVDTIDAPHSFVGTVKYTLYTGNDWGDNYVSSAELAHAGSTSTDYELFTISERDYDNDTSVTITTCGGKYTYTVPLDGTEVACNTMIRFGTQGSYRAVYISIKQDKEAGTETMSLRFEDDLWQIEPNGFAELELQTQNITAVYNSVPAAYNTATLIPADNSYDETLISKGSHIMQNGENYGVRDSAFISTDVTFPTTSSKEISIKETAGSGEITVDALGSDSSNAVLINDYTKSVTYTLTVNNAESAIMNKLVIIDNLPQVGDMNTLSDKISRDSAFRVNLSATPNFKVLMNGSELASDRYVIEYSMKSGNFTDEDWEGAGEGWTEWSEELSAEQISEIRSIRIVIDDGTVVDEENTVTTVGDSNMSIPAGATISLSFDAVIDTGATGENAAEAGETAWNTFGYQYLVIGDDNKANYLFAAPLKVGLSIPTIPNLSKNLVDSLGATIEADKDESFKFIIYSGDVLVFDEYSPETVGNRLAEEGREFTYVELVVPAGESESEVLQLESLNKYSYTAGGFVTTDEEWDWGYSYDESGNLVTEQYNIIELDTNGLYEFTTANGTVSMMTNGSLKLSNCAARIK